jgi:hypothetical protein
MTEVFESHNDVSEYEKFFKKLGYKVTVRKDMVIDSSNDSAK